MRTKAVANELRAKVIELRKTGLTMQQIADSVGRSKARVAQLLSGVPAPPVRNRNPSFKIGVRTPEQWQAMAQRTADRRWESEELDVKLDLLLGAPENLSAYQDCLQQARWEGARTRSAT